MKVVRMPQKEWHHKRKRIIEENLMENIDLVDVSDRNKDIVRMYVSGSLYREICEKHHITKQTVSDIISRYIRKAHELKKK